LFGRRKQEAAAEVARENERRALFEKLAQRPETVCPFLGLADDRVGYSATTTDEHRCYAFGDPAPLSSEQQERVCLQRGYGNCPRYLRGVLVIPTDELEALRHPRPMPAAPPIPEPEPARRRGFPIALVGVVVLLLLVAGGVGYLLTRPAPGVAVGSSSPTPAATTPGSSPIASTSTQPSSSITVDAPAPCVQPPADARATGYKVIVPAGPNTLFEVDDSGAVVRQVSVRFNRFSGAPVAKIDDAGGRRWETLAGTYTGLSYIARRTSNFQIRQLYGPDGSAGCVVLPPSEE
jgi:hypothetical protein